MSSPLSSLLARAKYLEEYMSEKTNYRKVDDVISAIEGG